MAHYRFSGCGCEGEFETHQVRWMEENNFAICIACKDKQRAVAREQAAIAAVSAVGQYVRKPLTYKKMTPQGAIVATDESTRGLRKRHYAIFLREVGGAYEVVDVLRQSRIGAEMSWMVNKQPEKNCSPVLSHFYDAPLKIA